MQTKKKLWEMVILSVFMPVSPYNAIDKTASRYDKFIFTNQRLKRPFAVFFQIDPAGRRSQFSHGEVGVFAVYN